MDPIRTVLARAGRRMLMTSWLAQSCQWLTVAIGLAVGARGAQKLFPVLTVQWSWVLPALVAGAVVVALAVAYARRPKTIDVARRVDESAGLRETLSTALCVERDAGPWSRAIVDDANHRAGRVVVRDAVPIAAPRSSWWPVAACAALLAVWWVPATDLAGMLAKKQQAQQDRETVRAVAEQVSKTQDEINDILAKAGVEVEQNADAEDLFKPEQAERLSAEEMQRAAIKSLTELSDKLEAERSGEEGATFDAIRDAMKRLETPEPGPATEMSRAMARGDFAEAKNQLDKLAEQIQSGAMSPEAKSQLEKQLEQMSEALGEMAQNREQLQEQLREAGLSEQQAQQLATDPDALEQALRDQGLDQQQIDRLKQQAQAQQRASDAAGAMSQAMGQMAQGMQSESGEQTSQGLESMSGQLSNLEKTQSEMQALERAMGECKNAQQAMGNQACENPGNGGTFGDGSQWGPNGQYSQGLSMNQGKGSGGPGKGMGTSPDEQASDFMLKSEKAEVNTTGDGPVIASTLVYGSQIKGESKAAFSQAASSAEARAAEAIETKRVPREHENAVKSYFGRLKRATEPSPAPANDGQGKDNAGASSGTGG